MSLFEGLQSDFTKTLTISSGKGGVGKTSIACNVAAVLAEQGKRVLILDGDLGMANVDIMFGVKARKSILNAVNGEETLDKCIVELAKNIHLLSGGSGVKELQKINDYQRQHLLDQLNSLPMTYDYLIIDTAPGIDDNVLYLNSCVHERNIVITPEPASLTDSYALIKVLNKYHKITKFSIITNFVKDQHEGLALYKKLSDITEKFLNVSLDYKGSVPMDLALRKATKAQQLVTFASPQSLSSLGLKDIAKNIKNVNDIEEIQGGMSVFWNHVFGVA